MACDDCAAVKRLMKQICWTKKMMKVTSLRDTITHLSMMNSSITKVSAALWSVFVLYHINDLLFNIVFYPLFLCISPLIGRY